MGNPYLYAFCLRQVGAVSRVGALLGGSWNEEMADFGWGGCGALR